MMILRYHLGCGLFYGDFSVIVFLFASCVVRVLVFASWLPYFLMYFFCNVMEDQLWYVCLYFPFYGRNPIYFFVAKDGSIPKVTLLIVGFWGSEMLILLVRILVIWVVFASEYV